MEDNFYTVLPSNVSDNYFPDNTISNYTTKLASRLIFKDTWEVGLVEISYTPSWYNITKTMLISFWYYDNDSTSYGFTNKTFLQPGSYNSINELLDEINKSIKTYFTLINYETTVKPKINVLDRTKIVNLRHGTKNNKLVLIIPDDDFCHILGINPTIFNSLILAIQNEYRDNEIFIQLNKNYFVKRTNEILNSSEKGKQLFEKYKDHLNALELTLETDVFLEENLDYIELKAEFDDKKLLYTRKLEEIERIYKDYSAENPFDLSGGYHSIFVYCDIVKPSFVGDSFTQLLRLVEISPNITFGKQETIKFSNVYYIPLLVKEFETIEIDIKSDTGEQIPFTNGRTYIVLHFRKKEINKR